MKLPDESRFELLWKGRQSGPFSLAAIREKLDSGEISRMHQINFRGKWIVLDEFLEKHAGGNGMETRLQAEAGQRSPLSHLLPPRPPHPEQSEDPAHPDAAFSPASFTDAVPEPAPASWLAIAALTISLCNFMAITAMIMGLYHFVPYRDLIPGILALFLGHIALSQTSRNPALGGRGMAIASLAITYFLLVMGITFAVLMLSNSQRLF